MRQPIGTSAGAPTDGCSQSVSAAHALVSGDVAPGGDSQGPADQGLTREGAQKIRVVFPNSGIALPKLGNLAVGVQHRGVVPTPKRTADFG